MTNEERLGQMVQSRMDDLQLSQDAVTLHGGPAVVTLRKVLRGESVRTRTYRQIEAALGWPAGLTQRVLAGGEVEAPRPAETDPLQEASDVALLAEIGRRLAQRGTGGSDAGNPRQKTSGRTTGDPEASGDPVGPPSGATQGMGELGTVADPALSHGRVRHSK